MILADFTISIEFETTPREVRVIVYDSVKGLRIATTRYENRTRARKRKQRGGFADTLGVCHRFTWVKRDGEMHPQCAIVRLAAPNLGVGIISHELTHAAVWIHELNEGSVPLTCVNDETLAWMVGELVRQTVNAMYARKVYDVVGIVADT